jgi:hypothetical protein
MLNILEY